MLGWDQLIFNHITLRVPGPQPHFLINPSAALQRDHGVEPAAHRYRGQCAARDRVAGDRAVSSSIGDPRSVPEAHCVMHTHTTTGSAVACLKDGLSPDNFYGAMLHGQVAYHDFEGVTTDPDEKQRLVRDIGDKKAVILRHHACFVGHDVRRHSWCSGRCNAPATCRSRPRRPVLSAASRKKSWRRW